MRRKRWCLLAMVVFLVVGGLTGCDDSENIKNLPVDRYTLTVEKTGNGTGRVTSDPQGVDCGGTCAAEWEAGAQVTLAAQADQGAVFSGWGGPCHGDGPCTVTLDGDVTVTAIFEPMISAIGLERLGAYATGVFDGGAAEIVAHDPATGRLFVVNGDAAAVDVLDVSDPADPRFDFAIDIAPYGASVNSVAFHDGLLAAAVENEDPQAPGSVVLFDADGAFLASVPAGALPDMVTFTPDGTWLLVANEGEPDDDYTVDPEGSVTIVDLRAGVENASAATAGFTGFNDRIDQLRAAGVNIYGPGASVAQDLEPEYIAVTPDSGTAWVSLQENNALAEIDIESAVVLRVLPLGFKDHSAAGNGMDASNEDGGIDIRPRPVFGMYQPDAIAVFEAGGRTYIATANEGDSRDYDAFSEEERVGGLMLDPTAFPDAETLQTDANLGRLKVTLTRGDIDGDGDFDALYSYGARSFSIWEPTIDGLSLVYDSGDDFERITAQRMPSLFNASNDENEADDRSDDKGPEPEGIEIGRMGGRIFAFIGLERIGGIMVYDITDPTRPAFVRYVNDRDPQGDPAAGTAGDLAPEGIAFIPASASPAGRPLLAVTNEVSGTTTLYGIEPVDAPFTLQILHSSDNESSFQDPNTLEPKLLNYATVVDGLQTLADREKMASLHLTAGDHTLPGPFYTAAEDVAGLGAPGLADIAFFNAMGLAANGIGNHEFDGGLDDFARMLAAADYPFLAVNLDFSNARTSEGMPPIRIGVDGGSVAENAGKVARSAYIEAAGERIGLIGRAPADFFNVIKDPETTLPGVDFVGGRDPDTNQPLVSAVGQVLAQVDLLTAQGIDKIILLDHAQDFTGDPLSAEWLRGVDIIVAAGSTGFMAAPEPTGPFNFLREGDTPGADYPTVRQDSEGNPVLVVNSDQQYTYVGNLMVIFDSRGHIAYVDPRSGPVATTDAAIEALEATLGEDPSPPDAVETVFADLTETEEIQEQFEVVGTTVHPLNGNRADVRSRETNLGRLAADSTLWYARREYPDLMVDVALKNGGGIRDTIQGPNITRLTIGAALAFDNKLAVVALTGREMLAVMENAVSRAPALDGRFPQVAGMALEYDPEREGISDATALDTPSRVRTLRITRADGAVDTLVENFALVGDPDRTFTLATNDFLLTGGDGYAALKAAADSRGAEQPDLGERRVLEAYITESLNGLVEIQDPPPNPRVVPFQGGAPAAVVLKVIETTDVHGSLFPYDFIEDTEIDGSLAEVHAYVAEQRTLPGQEVILLDGGDILQGQPIVNYYNYEKDPAVDPHIVPDVMNYMGYDAGVVGNHDIEPGPAVYDAVNARFSFPWLSANTVRTSDGEPYFQPYTVIERSGVRIAVLGLTTPGIPNWLPQSVWEGLAFEDMIESARHWVPVIQETEDPDVLIGLFHSGFDYTYGGTDADTHGNENASQLVAQQVPGFDLICIGHDHMDHNEMVNGVRIIGADNAAMKVATATIELIPNPATGGYDKVVTGEVVDPTAYEPDPGLMAAFADAVDETRAYAGERIGIFAAPTSSRDAMFGDSSFNDLIHTLQLQVAENVLGRPADVSFAAPLQFDKTIQAGPVYVRDMYKLYKYENFLYLMTLSGKEIKDFLEYSYEIWMNRMAGPEDHLLNFTDYDEATGNYDLAARYYNYDSAAGIVYDVDVSRPAGERVIVHGMDRNLDGEVDPGSAFRMDGTYTVAINSYRGGGGGGHLLAAGLTQEEIDAESRKTAQTERDLRYYLMEEIRSQGTVTPAPIGHWRVIPEDWARAGMERDYPILYGTPTFAVLSDPHLYDPELGTEGAAFEAYLARDRKLLRESGAILDAALGSVTEMEGVDFLLIPGDLTKDGEGVSHQMLAERLRAIENAGVPVYVVPGNHDINNPHAHAYEGEVTLEVPTVTPEGFADLYADFGYGEALFEDPDSLSYVAEPVPGLWLLALDSCKYDENLDLDKAQTGGRFSPATLDWITARLADARDQNKQVIAMMHHGLLEHFQGQSEANPGSEYVVDDWETVSRALAEAGLKVVFTGHYHAQDITAETWDGADGPFSLLDVQTGSLVTYPNPFRTVTLDRGNLADIETHYVETIDYDTGLMTFPDYARAYLEEGIYGLAHHTLTQPVPDGGYGLSPEEADQAAPLIVSAFEAHYQGNESPGPETLGAIDAFLASSDPAMVQLGMTLSALWTDPPPDDLSLEVDLDEPMTAP